MHAEIDIFSKLSFKLFFFVTTAEPLLSYPHQHLTSKATKKEFVKCCCVLVVLLCHPDVRFLCQWYLNVVIL
jgi:hypothetical protein